MDTVSLASTLVALISVIAVFFTQRAARTASILNTRDTNRTDMEKEAYQRARDLDTETIDRLVAENRSLRKKLAIYERGLSPDEVTEEEINVRADDDPLS